MSFIDRLAAILFPPSTVGPSDYEAARLARAKEDARWHQYDEPSWLRKERALCGERKPIQLRKAG